MKLTMVRTLISAVALSSSVAATAAGAATVTVNGASGPWDASLNPSYPYGEFANGQQSVNLAPTVVDVSPLSSVTITSLTPGQLTLLAGDHGSLWSDADGVSSWGPYNAGSHSPGQYIPQTVYLEELVGTFSDNGVIVGTPFAVGNGPTTETVPLGANELQLGVVDNWYNDNGGSVQVNVTVPEVCSTMGLLGLAVGGLAFIRRRTAV